MSALERAGVFVSKRKRKTQRNSVSKREEVHARERDRPTEREEEYRCKEKHLSDIYSAREKKLTEMKIEHTVNHQRST